MITLDIPVLLSKEWNHNMASKIRKFTGKTWFVAIISTIVVYFVSGFLIQRFTDDPRPWIDAIAFSISLSAGIISFLRYNNNTFGGWHQGLPKWFFGTFLSDMAPQAWQCS